MAEVSEIVLSPEEIRRIINNPPPVGSENQYGIERSPFVITTELNLNQNLQYLYCNPREVSFQLGIRGTEGKIKAGAIQHTWFDPHHRKTFYDEPTLGFQFQSGNTTPVFLADGVSVKPPQGLKDMYALLELFDQPRILPDGRPNLVYIIYTSRNFPSITFVGFFTPDGFSFTDSASDPTILNMTANFVVYDSYPKLSDSLTLKQIYSEFSLRGFAGRRGGNIGSTVTSSGILSDAPFESI